MMVRTLLARADVVRWAEPFDLETDLETDDEADPELIGAVPLPV